jgi:hypothetical protein
MLYESSKERKMLEDASRILRIRGSRYPRGQRKLLLLASSLLLAALFAAGCNLQSTAVDPALESTRVALEVQSTVLAMQQTSLTQQASSQTEVVVTQAEPPTPAPPTPEPQAEEPLPTATIETAPSEIANMPVEGSLTRADYDPATNWGNPHDAESFDGSKGLFPASSAGAANSWYANGRYHISFTSRGRWTWYWTFIEAGDFFADVVITNGDKCVNGDTAGMVFRGDSIQDYGIMFGISCGGDYFIGLTAIPGAEGVVCTFDNGNVDCVNRRLIHSEFIDTGPGSANRIGVMAKGGDLNFYINGRWVDSTSLGAFSTTFDRGNLALYLGSAQKPDAEVKFDDFSIWYLK